MAIDRKFYDYLCEFVTDHKLELFDSIARKRTRHISLVIEDIYQTHNASACLRSCDCFGIQDVHIIENRYDFEVNVDVALGSAQWLTIHRYRGEGNQTERCIKRLREAGYQLVATTPSENGCDLEDFDISPKTALMFGTEMEGLSDEALAAADKYISIPMFGFTRSFNISVAAAISLHHLSWKLRQTDVDWHLSERERHEIKYEWIKQVIGHRLGPMRRHFESSRQTWKAD